MRTWAEQRRGLAELAALVPDAALVVPVNAVDVLALRKGEREVVFVVGGYDVWTIGGGAMLDTDLNVEDAAASLNAAS